MVFETINRYFSYKLEHVFLTIAQVKIKFSFNNHKTFKTIPITYQIYVD